jgi:hypothetical protein
MLTAHGSKAPTMPTVRLTSSNGSDAKVTIDRKSVRR